MLSKSYSILVTMAAVLLSFLTALGLAHGAGLPAPALAVPAVVFGFMLSRRPGGEARPEKLTAAAVFSVLAGASTWFGPQLARHPLISGAVFVVFIGGSVWARRFGPVATRLGTMAPAVAISCLLASPAGPADVPWWPECGWTALVALCAFTWVRGTRWLGERLTGIPGPLPRPASPRRDSPRPGMANSTRMALQAALSLAAALTAGHLLFGAHWQWCAISVMVVSLGTAGRGDLALRGIERGLGALAGTLLAAALAAVAEPHGTACIVVIFVLLGLASGLRQYNYAFYACGITAVLSELYGFFGEPAGHLLPIRLEALSLGAAIAVAVGWFVLPVRARDVLRVRLAVALAALSALLAARRAGAGTREALAAFDAAAENVRAAMRPHRLHQWVLRLTRTSLAPHPADAGEALLRCRAPVHALAATEPGPHERATAAAIGILRRALADPAALRRGLSEPAGQGPLANLDTALRQVAVAVPVLRPRGSTQLHIRQLTDVLRCNLQQHS
jgi:Fusaric acid resistance protein-like